MNRLAENDSSLCRRDRDFTFLSFLLVFLIMKGRIFHLILFVLVCCLHVSGNWKPGWRHLWMCGPSIRGSTVGIIGLGRIGSAVADLLIPFKPGRILYSGNSRKEDFERRTGAEYFPLHQLLKSSDFVIVCCSLNQATKGLIDQDCLNMMKPEAILINTSRGGVIDQTALVRALQTGQIRAAGLDVYEEEPLPPNDPLHNLPNVGQSLSL